MTPGIRPIVAGNWKMNGYRRSRCGELRAPSSTASCPASMPRPRRCVCVPGNAAVALGRDRAGAARSRSAARTATPRTAAPIPATSRPKCCKDAGATHVIVGHSERRTDHGETDAMVHAKAEAAWRAGLIAIICIGETRASARPANA